jgi:asparagine synthase (glutamine-hydrolysing)
VNESNILIKNSFGWSFHNDEWGSLWFKGFIYNENKVKDLIKTLRNLTEADDQSLIQEFLMNLDGNFSFVVKTNLMTFAAVDKIRSIPIFYVTRANEILITDQPESVLGQLNNNEIQLNLDAELMLRMSGYCTGNETLLTGLSQLQPGEYLHLYDDNLVIQSYYTYRPFLADQTMLRASLKTSLTEITLNILKKIIHSANGRMIVIPLSGGYDSRVIVSGLFHLEYKNVKCFSYGQKNNFESKISEMVADHLGYPWKFIELTHKIIQNDYVSDKHNDYLSFSNTFSSVQVEHEFSAVRLLKESNWVSDDAIFINGMSGDFLTGSHIPKILQDRSYSLSGLQRKDQVLNALFDQHYSLWDSLKSSRNKEIVFNNLWNEIKKESNGLPVDSNNDFGLYEFSEFKNRQTRYVITVQRVYEFFGYDWRLPLWDREYLNFWEKIQLTHKIDRNLFIEMVKDNDWGGVWSLQYPVPYLTPKWIGFIRYTCKIPFVLFGRKKWKLFDKRFFYYWTEILCKMGVVPYYKVVLNTKGYRNAVSWLSENYVKKVRSMISNIK